MENDDTGPPHLPRSGACKDQRSFTVVVVAAPVGTNAYSRISSGHNELVKAWLVMEQSGNTSVVAGM